MAAVEVKIVGERELLIFLKDKASNLPAHTRRALQMSLAVIEAAAAQKAKTVMHVGGGGHVHLWQSISSNLIDDYSGVVGSNLIYSAIQEFGGDIVPKNGKYLTIPFPGVKGTARDYPTAFLVMRKSGNPILAMKGSYKTKKLVTGRRVQEQRGSGLTPLFTLVRKVHIPARPYMGPAFLESIPKVEKIFDEELGKVINQ